MRSNRIAMPERPARQAFWRLLPSAAGLIVGTALLAPARAEPGVTVYTTQVQPLLVDRCGACHGEKRHKGELSLHTPEGIRKGGENGPVLMAREPAKSEMVRRLRLPVSHDDHMPPQGKPQLSEAEIKSIEAWIAAGADFGSPSSAPAAAPTSSPSSGKNAVVEARDEISPANPAALAALNDKLVHVEAVRLGSNRLRLGFAASANKLTEAEVVQLLEPVLPQVEWISLARCAVGDPTAQLLARAPRLEHLDLRASRIGDAGVAALSHLGSLRELILAQTRLTDAVVPHLLAFPRLERLYLWKSGLTPAAIGRLREQRPQLRIDTGEAQEAVVREVEPKIKLTSDAPPFTASATQPAVVQSQPAAPAAKAAPAAQAASKPAPATGVVLQSINSKCPVSGSPVDSRYTIIYNGRLVGFCCPKCPSQFWADPAKFEAKLSLSENPQ